MNLRANQKRWSFSLIRVLMCLLIVGTALGAAPAPAQASGPFTHNEVVRLAMGGGYGAFSPALRNLLTTYPGAVESGSIFPDWGMAVNLLEKDKYDDLAEMAHWPGFVDGYIKYIKQNFTPPYDDVNELKTFAFLYGVIAHQAADNAFHYEYIPIAQKTEPADIQLDQWDHKDIEAAVDALNIAKKYLVFIGYSIDWYLPTDAILFAYKDMIAPDLSLAELNSGWDTYKFRSIAQMTLEFSLYPNEIFLMRYGFPNPLNPPRLVWTPLTYFNYPDGGTEDQARHSVTKWAETWAMWKPMTTASLSPATPDGKNGWYRQPVTVTLSASTYFTGSYSPGPLTTKYSLDGGEPQVYTAPFTISSDGAHQLTYFSVDTEGNSEVAKTLAINIDMTPPTITIKQDKTSYTRADPLTVLFDVTDATSGVASVLAKFNNTVVVNGQAVDLFWLPLGKYTIGVTAEDKAGNTSTASQEITLIATIEGLQKTVTRLCKEGLISKPGICQALSFKLKAALAAQKRGNLHSAVNTLQAFQNSIQAQTGKAIQPRAAKLLMLDSTFVIGKLAH